MPVPTKKKIAKKAPSKASSRKGQKSSGLLSSKVKFPLLFAAIAIGVIAGAGAYIIQNSSFAAVKLPHQGVASDTVATNAEMAKLGVKIPSAAQKAAAVANSQNNSSVDLPLPITTRGYLTKDEIRARMVNNAAYYIGVGESPANSGGGGIVRIFQRITGAYNEPWCASFTSYIFYGIYLRRDLISSSVASVMNQAVSRNDRYDTGHRNTLKGIKKGDMIITTRNGGHIGIFVGVSQGKFVTIEGNVYDPRRRNWFVSQQKRNKSFWTGYVAIDR